MVTKYRIWHSWAMVIVFFFSFLIKIFLSHLTLIGHDNFVGFFLNNIFIIFSVFLFSFFIFYSFYFYFFWLAAMGHHRAVNLSMFAKFLYNILHFLSLETGLKKILKLAFEGKRQKHQNKIYKNAQKFNIGKYTGFF